MRTPDPQLPPQLEQANELAWVLLAIDRFESVGNRERAGEALIKAGFAEKMPGTEKYMLTAKGQDMVARIQAAR